MLTGIKGNDITRINDIHERILKLADDISFRVFPIYIRYIKGDDVFALLYFNLKEHCVLGIATPNKISDKFENASWMKYKEIKYCIKIENNEDLNKLFNLIKFNL